MNWVVFWMLVAQINSVAPKKVIYLIRHGQAEHNVDSRFYIPDPLLTDVGIGQARKLHQHLDESAIINQIDLIMVSPLTRTLQTAQELFASRFKRSNNCIVGECTSDTSKILALEVIRECYGGLHVCDKRSAVSTLTARFGSFVDFSLIQTDDDVLFTTTRESDEHLTQRAIQFIEWVQKREESTIAVVSHHGFILRLLQYLRQHPQLQQSSNVLSHQSDDLENCEMRTIYL